MSRSAAKSITRRKALTNDARKYLAAFQAYATEQRTAEQAGDDVRADLFWDHATKRLLWAQARIQQALALQTNGRLGNPNATLATVLHEEELRTRATRG